MPIRRDIHMTYQELLENAKTNIGPYCKACPVCNGRACKNAIPGPGSKGVGDTAVRNYDAWKNISILQILIQKDFQKSI